MPNKVNLQSELVWLCGSSEVMINSANTLLVIAMLLNNENTLIGISLFMKLLSGEC
jgi:hypothetical protein